MKKTFFAALFAAFALTLGASVEPSVANIIFLQDIGSATATIYYDLSTTAIVTVDVLTNGVSIGAAHLKRLSGDVNRKVASGPARRICWAAGEDFPEHFAADGSMTAVVKTWSECNPPDYMVLDLTVTNGVRYYVSADALPLPVGDIAYKTDRLVMRRVHAAGIPWRMGTPRLEIGAETGEVDDLSTAHQVVLTEDYYIGIYEVTQRQFFLLAGGDFNYGWQALEGCNFRAGTASDYFDASKTLPANKMSFRNLRGTGVTWPSDGHKVGSDGYLYRARQLTGIANLDLPTEAQWEYACRAGFGTAYGNGKDCARAFDESGADANAADIAWYGSAYGGTIARNDNSPKEVGTRQANAWGFYDMHGNVFEMCLDWYASGDDYRATFAPGWRSGEPTIDPAGPASGTQHVFRGGDYYNSASRLRAGYRYTWETFTDTMTYEHWGFRLASVIRAN